MYNNIIEGIFLNRPNRFVANVLINGKIEKAHVKNTGRCKELLKPNSKVFLEDNSHNSNRKTKYSLISVYKKNKLVNIDSQVPNKVVYNAIKNKKIQDFNNIIDLQKEKTFLNSRFDFYYSTSTGEGYIEVKGVTLEKNNIAMFPDAPTSRGTKHVNELVQVKKKGLEANLLFLIQMKGPIKFRLNWEMDPIFSNAVYEAYLNGVNLIAYDSIITKNNIVLSKSIPIDLKKNS